MVRYMLLGHVLAILKNLIVFVNMRMYLQLIGCIHFSRAFLIVYTHFFIWKSYRDFVYENKVLSRP